MSGTVKIDKNLPPSGIASMIWFCPAHEKAARELRDLPQAEREKVWADLSGDGVEAAYPIKPDDVNFVTDSLEQMEIQLSNITEKNAFLAAQQSSPQYVNEKSFRLMFLRASSFDAKQAAAQIVGHFDTKEALFGTELLGRDILYSDLSEDDISSLYCGGMQLLSEFDKAGRPILYCRYMDIKYSFLDNMVSCASSS